MAEFFTRCAHDHLWAWLARLVDTFELGYLLAALVHCALLINVVAVGALAFIWLERKVAGRIQDRLGPTRVGGKFGWLQTLADGVKLITKEDLMPAAADPLLFRVAVYVSFCASVGGYLALPFADDWVALRLNVAAFFVIAVLGLEVFGVILAGYASGSKWSLFGAMREGAQVVSYEVPLGLCALAPVMIAGSMDLVTIGQMQRGWGANWIVLHDPFTFVIFWIYFTCATASVNRAPFDLAEAESELVAGFHTEYSGLRWSMFFMAEYGSMFAVSGLAAILFFGGWNGPLPICDWLGLTSSANPWLHYLGNLMGMFNFMFKCVLGVTVMMWVRWTLPRLRIDQVMTVCLKYCTPLAAVSLSGAALWLVALPSGLLLKSSTPLGHFREGAYATPGQIDAGIAAAPTSLPATGPAKQAPNPADDSVSISQAAGSLLENYPLAVHGAPLALPVLENSGDSGSGKASGRPIRFGHGILQQAVRSARPAVAEGR